MELPESPNGNVSLFHHAPFAILSVSTVRSIFVTSPPPPGAGGAAGAGQRADDYQSDLFDEYAGSEAFTARAPRVLTS